MPSISMRSSLGPRREPDAEPMPTSLDLTDAVRASLICRRSSPRRPVRWNAVIYCRNRSMGVVIRNVSRGGVMIQNAFGLMQGDSVRIAFLSGRTLEGCIMWSLSPYCGMRFDSELAADDPILFAR